MQQRTLVLVLGGVVAVLLGVVLGQNLERARTPAETTGKGSASGRDTELLNAASPPALPAASATEYWVSVPDRDASRVGFAAWAVLRPGGRFLLERCRAPDYSLPANPRAPVPPDLPTCELALDGVISSSVPNLIVARGEGTSTRTVRYSFTRNGAKETIVLDLGEKIELVPGAKNALFERLRAIPSDEAARKRYHRRMEGLPD
jgi:hypothetical protein